MVPKLITPDQHWSNLSTLLECVLTLLQSVQVPINPYGKAKKMAEDIILDYVKSNTQLAVMILRCVNLFLDHIFDRNQIGEFLMKNHLHFAL